MKLHKITAIILLVLVISSLLIVPVAADKTVTPVAFRFVAPVSYDGTTWRLAGPIEKLGWMCLGSTTGDAAVTGSLSWTIKLDYVWPNAHTTDYHILWMPGQGQWRLEVPGGGWEGSVHINPWIISEKWPEAVQLVASGTGFGVYKNMRIKFTLNTETPEDPMTFVFVGEISAN